LLLAYWFLTLLRLHPFAAGLGAVVWAFSGFMVSEGMFGPLLGSAVWLPMASPASSSHGGVVGGWGCRSQGWRWPLPSLLAYADRLYVWIAAAIWQWGRRLSTPLRHGGSAAGRGAGVRAGCRLWPAGVFAIAGGLASIQLLGTLE